jgi:ADP-ribose pyrophosphatase
MTLLSSRRIHSGRVVSLDIDTVEFPNGSVGELEMLRHPGAAAVLPFLDDPGDADPRVILIRQFRHATDGWLWEIPAGRREHGEPPLDTAHRELAEETGYRAAVMEPLTAIWTTPGFTDEVIHLFLASGLTAGDTAHERDEVMELHELRWSGVLRMVREREIVDTKTLNAILYTATMRRATGDGSA